MESRKNTSKKNPILKTPPRIGFFSFIMVISLNCLISCKSAPKRAMIITSVYNSAFEEIASANGCILTGDYATASALLDQAYIKAMSIDNYELLVSSSLSYISLTLSYKAAKIDEAYAYLKRAKEFVPYSSMQKKQEALITLNEIRIKTSELTSAASQNFDLQALLKDLIQAEQIIKDDPYYLAQFKSAAADLYKAKKDYISADQLYVEAAQMYTKKRYLSEIGITWYKAAQVRSLAEKKSAALEALENAIYYDRAAENSLALGTDYYAKGTILLKGNPGQSEKKEAQFAFRHSAAIFDSISQHELAQRSTKKAEELQEKQQ
mgnify:CR=1 FL=1